MRYQATWNGHIIAESSETVILENNVYFPPESVNQDFLQKSDAQTVCHWKGTASYFNLVVDGKTNVDAGWYYPQPNVLAKGIKGKIAFWRGVKIEKNNKE